MRAGASTGRSPSASSISPSLRRDSSTCSPKVHLIPEADIRLELSAEASRVTRSADLRVWHAQRRRTILERTFYTDRRWRGLYLGGPLLSYLFRGQTVAPAVCPRELSADMPLAHDVNE